MAEISFFQEDIDFQISDDSLYSKWLESIVKYYNKNIETLNYIFTSDEYLLKVNQDYLNHDYYTDIISFPLSKEPISGDIFISIDRVKENSQTLETDFNSELHRVMAHGLLHFIGFDDHSEEDINDMRQAEDFSISLFEKL